MNHKHKLNYISSGEVRPTIGISCSVDSGEKTFRFASRSICYVDEDYAKVLAKAGAVPILIPYLSDKATVINIFNKIHGLILTGGGVEFGPKDLKSMPLTLKEQNHRRYDFDSFLLKEALSRNMPIIGICRGCQMLNDITGGELRTLFANEIETHMPTKNSDDDFKICHRVFIEDDTKLKKLIGEDYIGTNSHHLQAVKFTGPNFKISSYAQDKVPEAIESTKHPFALGLQFHPEKASEMPFSIKIWQSMVAAALEFSKK